MTSDAAFAEVVVRDTILSAHETPGLAGDETVALSLEQLRGPKGDLMVQGVLAQYAGSEKAAAAIGARPQFDLRVIQHIQNITADGVKGALLDQIGGYLGLPLDARQQILGEYRSLRNSSAQASNQPSGSAR
jgi:hypothetical protein